MNTWALSTTGWRPNNPLKPQKTNAMRILDRMRIAYLPHEYESDGEPKSGLEVAEELGVDPARIFKTLLAHAGTDYFVFIIPADRELDLKKGARACGAKKIEMLPAKEIFPLTGYHRGGCSPLGMKKSFPTYLDDSAALHESIYVSAGKIGQQIELALSDLLVASNAEYADLQD